MMGGPPVRLGVAARRRAWWLCAGPLTSSEGGAKPVIGLFSARFWRYQARNRFRGRWNHSLLVRVLEDVA